MTAPTPVSITSQIQLLSPDAIIELFDLDLTSVGGSVLHYHANTNGLYGNIVWQGTTYFAFPVIASGFEYNGRGQVPRPKMQVSNVQGAISALVLAYGDLVGCKVTRRRTFARYLDAVNYGGTNPNADPTAEFPQEIFFIEQRTAETRDLVEFQLSSAFDFQGLQLPRRTIIPNVCTWRYRVWNASTSSFDYSNATCPYTGNVFLDANDAVTTAANDSCGKHLSSCKARFGTQVPLPYGSFPACGINNS